MIYDSKDAARCAAERFGKVKMADGEFIKIIPRGDRVEVYHGFHTDSLDIAEFHFRTLKKGDICWVWDRPDSKRLRIFDGVYGRGKPMFSGEKDLSESFTWDNYEQTGLNIFDGGKNDER